ncbi:MAG: choice-of-anchor D domain-containing protein [Deltaproteobacteria bacterium]|nr:choice-of-anchor D domain-containing protein [Deltaproteobacteria bacterium]
MCLRRTLPGVTLALAALLGAGCEGDTFSAVEPVLEVSPDALDFGTVELGQDSVRTAELRSFSSVPSEISEIRIEDDCGGCFLTVNPTDEVPANQKYALDLKFRARRLEIATGTVTVVSDDPKLPEQVIYVKGRGTDTRRPDIEVTPEVVDFGFAPAGGVAVSSFVIISTGTNDLLIDRIRVEPADAPFRITTSTPTPERPGALAPEARASVGVRVELPASATGTVTASVFIETNVLEEKNVPGKPGWVQVPLHTLANLPPIAVAGEDQTVEPWSRVTLDGSASYDQDDPPDEPLTYRWRLATVPPGSTTELERARTAQPSFWADLSGVYELELIVIDALGLESEPAVVVVEALPTNAVRIELTWDHPDSDLDLHLIQQGGTFCDCATDVHYRDCGRTPNWFPQTPGANPRLDVDDTSGFGPENINIDGHGASRFIPDGTYTVAVHYYATNAQTSSWPTQVSTATVRIYIFGLLAAELTREMQETAELWIAGAIHWPDQTVTADGAVINGAICGVF